MSRSFRHTPVAGITTAQSEKDDKRRANRRIRSVNRQRVRAGLDPLDRRQLSSPWGFAKDGKMWWGDLHTYISEFADPEAEGAGGLLERFYSPAAVERSYRKMMTK